MPRLLPESEIPCSTEPTCEGGLLNPRQIPGLSFLLRAFPVFQLLTCLGVRGILIMAQSATLFKPPPLDSTKAPIENVLELTPVIDVGKVCLFLPFL